MKMSLIYIDEKKNLHCDWHIFAWMVSQTRKAFFYLELNSGLVLALAFNRICDKILDRDWFSARQVSDLNFL